MCRTDKKLILRKGGKLFLEYSEWVKEENVFWSKEITNPPNPYKLHDLPFEFEKGVTVEDLCIYLKKDMDYWEAVIGNCVREYVESCFIVPKKPDYGDGDVLEKCVLNWGMECTKFHGNKSINRPNLNFGMKGKNSIGECMNYGFGEMNLADIKDMPIEIDEKLIIYYENLDNIFPGKKKDWTIESLNHRNLFQKMFPKLNWLIYKIGYWIKHSKKEYGNMQVSMFDALYGIFWELSFYGPPPERKSFFEKIGKDLEEFDEAKENKKLNEA